MSSISFYTPQFSKSIYQELLTSHLKQHYEDIFHTYSHHYKPSSSSELTQDYDRSDLQKMYTTLRLEQTYQSLSKWEQDIRSFTAKRSLAEEHIKSFLFEVFRSRYQINEDMLKDISKQKEHIKILQSSILYKPYTDIEIDHSSEKLIESLKSSINLPEIDLSYYLISILNTIESPEVFSTFQAEMSKVQESYAQAYQKYLSNTFKFDIFSQIEKIQEMLDRVNMKLENTQDIKCERNTLDAVSVAHKKVYYTSNDFVKMHILKDRVHFLLLKKHSFGNTLVLSDTHSPRSNIEFFTPEPVNDFAVSNNEKYILLIYSNKVIDLRNLKAMQPIYIIKSDYNKLYKILFTRDDKHFITSSEQHLVIWNLKNKHVMNSLNLSEKVSINHMVLIQNDSRILLSNNKKEVFIINLETLRKERSLICQKLNIKELTVVYSEKYVIFNTDFKTILWDIQGNKEIFRIMNSYPYCVVKDRYLMLYSSQGNKVVVYDLKSRKSREEKMHASKDMREITTFIDRKLMTSPVNYQTELVVYYI